MEASSSQVNMGVILCQYCDAIIDTFEIEKVTTYYGICGSSSMVGQTCKQGAMGHEHEKSAAL
jgi:hypothetical protein